MKHFRLWGLLLPVCFTGCAVKIYQPPNLPDSQLATVTFKNLSSYRVVSGIYLGENCTEQRVTDRSPDGFALTPGQAKTYKLEAGKQFTFLYGYAGAPTYSVGYNSLTARWEQCSQFYAFTPEAGEYQFLIDGNPTGCKMAARQLTAEGYKPLERYKLIPKEAHTPFFNSGGFCR